MEAMFHASDDGSHLVSTPPSDYPDYPAWGYPPPDYGPPAYPPPAAYPRYPLPGPRPGYAYPYPSYPAATRRSPVTACRRHRFARAFAPGIIPLRPLSLSDIFNGAAVYIRANPKATLGLTTVVVVITQIITLAAASDRWRRPTA